MWRRTTTTASAWPRPTRWGRRACLSSSSCRCARAINRNITPCHCMFSDVLPTPNLLLKDFPVVSRTFCTGSPGNAFAEWQSEGLPSSSCAVRARLFFVPHPRARKWPGAQQDTFIFRVEGTGALPAQDIVATAMDVLIAKLRNLQVLGALLYMPPCPWAALRPHDRSDNTRRTVLTCRRVVACFTVLVCLCNNSYC